MTLTRNCPAGTLSVYKPSAAQPWNKQRVQHLYRRMSFGASNIVIQQALQKPPDQLVDELIKEAISKPLPPAPAWANKKYSEYQSDEEAFEDYSAWRRQWAHSMFGKGLREKMALFWHNHFVTQSEVYFCPSYLYQYHKLLQEFALGNFRNFTIEMGKTPAMLVYLNGLESTRVSPNENYARELFELFTLGRDNGYTEADIKEASRALTGWNGFTEACAPITYLSITHDPTPKTVFGKTGNWSFEDIHNLVFTERKDLAAHFICSKIYRFFVSPEPDETIIQGLAETFKAANFDVAPVLRQLFKSEHFFSDAIIGTVVKSPLDMIIGFIVDSGLPRLDDDQMDGMLYLSSELGQDLTNPPDVAGWVGDKTWINGSTLVGRWQTMRYYLYTVLDKSPKTLADFAKSVSSVQNDVDHVVQSIAEHLLPTPLMDYSKAVSIFKTEIPEQYFTDKQWNLNWDSVPYQVALLIDHLLRLPEFQLT